MGLEEDSSNGSCDNRNSVAFRHPGYVIRTDVIKRGTRAFINVCKYEGIGRPCFRNENDILDVFWSIPHGVACVGDDLAKRGDKCKVYDFIIHPNTFRMIEKSASFKKAVNDLAIDTISKQFNTRLDRKNVAFPDITYKGVVSAVEYIEKQAGISTKKYENELQEFYIDNSFEDVTSVSKERNPPFVGLEGGKLKQREAENEKSLTKEFISNETLFEFEQNSTNVNDPKSKIFFKKDLEINDDVVSISNTLNREEGTESVLTVDSDVSQNILPDYVSFQDKTSVTFIFDVKKLTNENVFLTIKSPKEILLRMMTYAEDGSSLNYVCCLKFGNKCCLNENECHFSVSESNVVLTMAKDEKSQRIWHSYFIGTSFQLLDVKDFTSTDNLKRELDSLDMNAASAAESHSKDDKSTKDIEKAEEREMEDVPGEIIVVHEKTVPRLHGILKQRSMSESSDDVSLWSCSTDHCVSTTTCSDTESEDYESSSVAFHPFLKKSVSFSEHIDETMFVVNQSVSQMHQTLKNKRRRMRKKEQKHEQKEARRRFRSNSDSCSHSDSDYIANRILVEKHLALIDRERKTQNQSDDKLCKSDKEIRKENSFDDSTGVMLSAEKELVKAEEADELEKIHKNLEGTSASALHSIDVKTSLETCTETNKGGLNIAMGVERIHSRAVDGALLGGDKGMVTYLSEAGTLDNVDTTLVAQNPGISGSVTSGEWTSNLETNKPKKFLEKGEAGGDDDDDSSAFESCDDDDNSNTLASCVLIDCVEQISGSSNAVIHQLKEAE